MKTKRRGGYKGGGCTGCCRFPWQTCQTCDAGLSCCSSHPLVSPRGSLLSSQGELRVPVMHAKGPLKAFQSCNAGRDGQCSFARWGRALLRDDGKLFKAEPGARVSCDVDAYLRRRASGEEDARANDGCTDHCCGLGGVCKRHTWMKVHAIDVEYRLHASGMCRRLM